MGVVTGALAPSGAPACAAMVSSFMRRLLRSPKPTFKRLCARSDASGRDPRRKKAPGQDVRGPRSEALRCRDGGGDQYPGFREPLRWLQVAGFVPTAKSLIQEGTDWVRPPEACILEITRLQGWPHRNFTPREASAGRRACRQRGGPRTRALP